MRIAVDAMGGDFAPREIVKGAVEAGRNLAGLTKLFLVGDETAIKAELAKYGKIPDIIEVRHASEVVGMSEHPALAIRNKKDSSIGRAVDLVKNKEADAVVSAGNTGAVVVAATLKLKTIKGVMRPAIATVLPTQNRPFVLIDAGACLDCEPELLHQFAVMGSVYSKNILKQASPKVGLLSIGAEDTKGNSITKQTFSLLEGSPCVDFKGNVEGHDLFEGETDVVVCDGFIGNIVLKTSESVAHAISHWIKQECTKNIMRLFGAVLLLGAKKALKQKMDPELYGGAPLLGVNGTCIITHGASTYVAIYHAVRVACEAVNNHIDDQISESIAKITSKAQS